MKVLIVTNHILSDNGGGSFASRAFINAFSELADQCTLLYPTNGMDISKFISAKIKIIGVKNSKSSVSKLLDIYSGKINRFHEIGPLVIDGEKPDVVVFDNSRASSGLLKCVNRTMAKVITIHHNFEKEYYASSKENILWRYPLMKHMVRIEQEAVKSSDLNFTLTGADSILLSKQYANNSLESFHEVGCFESRRLGNQPIDNLSVSGNSIEFVISGSLSDSQTADSLHGFFRKYLPVLHAVCPDSHITIAGKNPSKQLISACSRYSFVKLIQNPDDMNAILKGANIYLCPIDRGGGMKLRLMDGLRMGIPVLAHAVSERGYNRFRDLGYLHSYSDVDSFRKELSDLIYKVKSSAVLQSDIRNAYIQYFSFQSGVERIQSALKRLGVAIE